MASVPVPPTEKSVVLLRWCLGLLVVVLLLQCSVSSELAGLRLQMISPATVTPRPPTAAEIAAEVRKLLPIPVQYKLYGIHCGWDAHGIRSAQISVHRETGIAKDLAVSTSDGVEAELHALDDPVSYYIRFQGKPLWLPETWNFTLEYTAADGTRERCGYSVERDPTKTDPPSLILRRATP